MHCYFFLAQIRLTAFLFCSALLFAGVAPAQAPAKPFDNPAEQAGKPRVLLIGDSISIGYTVEVRQRLDGKALVFRPPVNCQHTGYGLANLEKWLGNGKWDVIHFNWGIWDTHLLDEKGGLVASAAESSAAGAKVRFTLEQYRENLEKLVAILERTGARLIWASTTPVLSRVGDRLQAVPDRNRIAAELMKKHGIAINDLHTAVLPRAKDWQSGDRVHFNAAGNTALGAQVARAIEENLP